MASTYIILVNWTDQGLKSVRESASRLDAAKKAIGSMGGRFVSFFLTMGEYDLVAVCEAPDDEAMARFSLGLARQGNVRAKTLKAFPEETYRKIIAEAP
ncbi:MAG: GYD domain-containing protein [Rhizobiaceae bacterium]